MRGFNSISKVLRRQGNSIVVSLSFEAKQMGLKSGDTIYLTIDTPEEARSKRFRGARALSYLESGHVLKSIPEDGTDPMYIAFDPMGEDRGKTYSEASMAIALSVPTDLIPKDVWALAPGDAIFLMYNTDWTMCDEMKDTLYSNTRTYSALQKTAIKSLVAEGARSISCDSVMYRTLRLSSGETEGMSDKEACDGQGSVPKPLEDGARSACSR